MLQQVYEDRWGEVFDRPSEELVELRWFDSTTDMSSADSQSWLATFAGCVEKCGRSRVLVDSTAFRMSPANMDGSWRDANIIPRYNAAGVARFAFHMPEEMPMIGAPPAPEGPGRFPTGYFGRRQDALVWLAG
ncbi:MAG: hypothetical protein DLM67_13000 [Candidatus Nephthysia bennettiae]|uniref:Transposase n=1 Tax=Candidatus Nephthysia bennettiae TaxID=3127016 RepID=A0A934NBG7_9BACT|nr:hypothetical protein [Candidatus Dormibacteraeota bacterium]PZR94033.1 MAG: hypothetical protein DLM67_13000 [Candidatus Dormibacteraeota bacterium]